MGSNSFFIGGKSSGRSILIEGTEVEGTEEDGIEKEVISSRKDFEGITIAVDQRFNLNPELEMLEFINRHDPANHSINLDEIPGLYDIMEMVESPENEKLSKELLKNIVRVDKVKKGRRFETVAMCKNPNRARQLMNKLDIHGVSICEEEKPTGIMSEAEFLHEKFLKLPHIASPRHGGKWGWKN